MKELIVSGAAGKVARYEYSEVMARAVAVTVDQHNLEHPDDPQSWSVYDPAEADGELE